MKKLYSFSIFLLLTVFAYSQGTWHQQTSFGGTTRYRATAFVVNGKCYVGTGSGLGTNNQQDIWEYDPAQNAWTQKADLTGPKRTLATGASDGTYGYIGLGSNNGVVLHDWWQFDPVANTWTQKTDFPSTSRYGAGAFTLGSRVYVGGGIDSVNSVHGDFFAYEPTTDQWIQRLSLPVPVTGMATYVINGKGYFVGGANNGGINGTSQNIEYDVANNTWTSRAAFGGGNIYSCVGFSIDNIGYVGTGFTTNLTDLMYSWDPVTDTWTQETSWPTGTRQQAVVCNVNNRAYVGTGNSTGGSLYNDWWEFVPITTGVKQNEVEFPKVSFDMSSHQIVVNDANGTEQFEILSVEGKSVLSGKLEAGNNLLYIHGHGIYFVRIVSSGKEKVTKLLSTE